ncbi:lipase family protein [Candidatus Gracilibacteria bacterium]|nr:lipase family protein [Candidatus Gracilibacteria bacterium]NJM89996.1 lipase family protein [Hydrococcus sp. RU_2_2]NJP22230.1 lipase family protein [Hydrococcus sp. CRU_1_1]
MQNNLILTGAEMTAINFKEILEYGLRSQLAYTISQIGWDITETLGWRVPNPSKLIIREVRRSEVNVIVEVDDLTQTQWIAVRGSSNLRNWLLNFRYMQRSFNKNFMDRRVNIDLHTGFYIAADDVYKAILPHLNKEYKTRIAGHSLGGAIAVILMMFLKEDGYQLEKCITFGQPKVTDKKGAQMCQHLPLLRIINHEDVVPLLPPGTILTRLQGGYHHFGSKIVLGEENGYTYTQPQALDNSMYNFWMRLISAIGQKNIRYSTENIKDHNLAFYLLKIAANLGNPEQSLEKLLCNLSYETGEFYSQLNCLNFSKV